MIDIWQEIYGTISRNKLRSFLTGFAVAWGIFMLIVLLGAGNGIIHAFEERSNEMASNSIKIFPGWVSKPYDGLKGDRPVRLDNIDLDITQTYFPDHVVNAGATVRQNNVIVSRGAEYVNLSFYGVYPNYPEVESITPTKGRFINQTDIKEHRKVIVLNEKTVEVLFKDGTDPIGQYVTGAKTAYKVVGLFTDLGDRDSRESYVPFSTVQLIYNKGDKLNNITFTTKGLESKEANEGFEKTYRAAIGRHHRFDPTEEGTIWIWNRFTQYLQQQTAANILRTGVWVIGIFTLLSGIVGVSNIMLITVKERTREFGIRKALGAKPSSILWLVIIESIFITTLFGYLGMVAGIGATEYMNLVAGKQTVDMGVWSETMFLNPTVDLKIAVQATLTLIIAGTLAGFFPARKAVSIRPIEALRAE